MSRIIAPFRSLLWKTDQVKGRIYKINQVEECASKSDQLQCVRIVVIFFLIKWSRSFDWFLQPAFVPVWFFVGGMVFTFYDIMPVCFYGPHLLVYLKFKTYVRGYIGNHFGQLVSKSERWPKCRDLRSFRHARVRPRQVDPRSRPRNRRLFPSLHSPKISIPRLQMNTPQAIAASPKRGGQSTYSATWSFRALEKLIGSEPWMYYIRGWTRCWIRCYTDLANLTARFISLSSFQVCTVYTVKTNPCFRQSHTSFGCKGEKEEEFHLVIF